jgi:hypothetical protein
VAVIDPLHVAVREPADDVAAVAVDDRRLGAVAAPPATSPMTSEQGDRARLPRAPGRSRGVVLLRYRSVSPPARC